MSPAQQIKKYRLLERVMMVLSGAFLLGLFWLWTTDQLTWYELYAGAGTTVVAFLVLFFIQRKLDELVAIAISQSEFVQDDVFTALYDNSPVAYLTILTDGTIVDSNPAAVKLLAGRAGAMSGLNIFDLVQPAEEVDISIIKSKVTAGLTVNDIELPIKSMVGTELWVLLSVYTHRDEGQRLMALVDVTEQKHIDVAKSEFVALATHQLRTPIAAIRWNVELLQKSLVDMKSDRQTRYLSKIERNVFRMINLINDFLSVSKLEMGTFAAREEEINLADFFTAIQDEFAEKIVSKQIVVNRQGSPATAVVKTDSRLFHIIVSNLVSNAVKYLQPQGRLNFSYQLQAETLEIVVADNGIGVPEGEVGNLFSKFFRASNAQSHQTEGTGLGLYVVKQSVELLGGTIAVTAKENEGARFVVRVPVQVVSVAEIS